MDDIDTLKKDDLLNHVMMKDEFLIVLRAINKFIEYEGKQENELVSYLKQQKCAMHLLENSGNKPEQFIKYCCSHDYLKKNNDGTIGRQTRNYKK